MSSKPIEPRSIAAQLVLLFTLSAAFLLSCGLGVFYWIVVRHAFEEDNAVLADKVMAVHETLKQPDGINTIDRELKHRMPGERSIYWVRVVDPDGNSTTQTPGMENILPAKVFPSPRAPDMPEWSITDYK